MTLKRTPQPGDIVRAAARTRTQFLLEGGLAQVRGRYDVDSHTIFSLPGANVTGVEANLDISRVFMDYRVKVEPRDPTWQR